VGTTDTDRNEDRDVKKQFGSTLVELITVIIILAGVVGWILNIVKLAESTFDPLTAIVVLRCLGVIVAPLGAVFGFI